MIYGILAILTDGQRTLKRIKAENIAAAMDAARAMFAPDTVADLNLRYSEIDVENITLDDCLESMRNAMLY